MWIYQCNDGSVLLEDDSYKKGSVEELGGRRLQVMKQSKGGASRQKEIVKDKDGLKNKRRSEH